MKHALLLAAALAAAVPAVPAGAATALRTLTVTGTGRASVTPDTAVVSFRIESVAATAASAMSDNTAKTSALDARLAALGVTPAAIRTDGFNVSYNPRPPQPNPQLAERFGFIVERTLAVTLDRIDRAGPVVDAGVSAGAQVGGVAFTVRDPRAAQRAAQAAAVADAQAQARTLAGTAHVRLGAIRSIAPSGGERLPQPRVFAAAAAAAPPTSFDTGDFSLTATVTVEYDIGS